MDGLDMITEKMVENGKWGTKEDSCRTLFLNGGVLIQVSSLRTLDHNQSYSPNISQSHYQRSTDYVAWNHQQLKTVLKATFLRHKIILIVFHCTIDDFF